MVTDPVADMLTRIRNAAMARQQHTAMPSSQLKREIARILKEEGFIENFEVTRGREDVSDTLRVQLRYTPERKPVISHLSRISRPGRRVYVGRDEIPWVLSGLGVAIMTTPKGIMTGQQARRMGIGGEVMCYIW
jgi:small subunit ribosomal protein S8